MFYGRAEDPVETRVIRLALRLLRHHADADRAWRLLPVGDDVGHRWIVRVDRLDDREPFRMGPLHFHRITGVVAVHGKGGDEDRAGDADFIHRRHHLVTCNVIGPVRHTVPGSLRSVRLIGVDLGIDDNHPGSSSVIREFGIAAGRADRVQNLGLLRSRARDLAVAKYLGATVITAASAVNHSYVRSLGADWVIDYNVEDLFAHRPIATWCSTRLAA